MTKQLPIGKGGVDSNAAKEFLLGKDLPCQVKITSHFPQKMIFSEVDLTIQNGETVVKTVDSQALLQRFVSSAAQVAFLNSCDLGLVLEIEQAETEPLAPPPVEEPKPEVKHKAKKTEAV